MNLTRILFIYCLVVTFLFFAGGILTAKSVEAFAFQLLFLPMAFYFAYTAGRSLGSKEYRINMIDLSVSWNKKRFLFTIILFAALTIIGASKVNSNSKPEDQGLIFSRNKDSALIFKSTNSEKKEESTLPSFIAIGDDYDTVNIRVGPSLDNEILGKYVGGTKLEVLDKKDDWYQVKTEEGEGWIHSDFVIIEEHK